MKQLFFALIFLFLLSGCTAQQAIDIPTQPIPETMPPTTAAVEAEVTGPPTIAPEEAEMMETLLFV